MDVYFLKPNRLVIEAENERDRRCLPKLHEVLERTAEMIDSHVPEMQGPIEDRIEKQFGE